ncbi:MAG: hypothetical protein K6F50_05740 [Kiritimatiellae bacterium]|nr:hypothetical protein [Kiritimatiellia bacterium]
MMNRLPTFRHAVAACAALTLCAGCYSLQRAKVKSTNQEHVLVSNYGWYLFDTIPLACGNASADPWTPWVMFRDDLAIDKIQSRFMEYANGQNADAAGMHYTISDSVMLQIPGINLPLPIPYLLSFRSIQLSGVLSACPAAAPCGIEVSLEDGEESVK